MQNPKRTEGRKNNAAKFNERKVKFWKMAAVSFFVNHEKYVTFSTQKSKCPNTRPRIGILERRNFETTVMFSSIPHK